MLPPSHRDAIRAIFLKRRREYTSREAASLLRLTLCDYIAWIESGTLDVQLRLKHRQLGGFRRAMVSWEELASAALLRWNVMQIHEALGDRAKDVMPKLLRPAELKAVRLPEYQVRLLETLARRARVTLDEYLFTALLDLEVAGDPDEIEMLLPGFKEAMAFPNA